ncbi:tetratricopeptide repeat protein [Geomesophilobacter sediminis]|nr:hypothetical protein [Geomesophilobacter sediminis]
MQDREVPKKAPLVANSRRYSKYRCLLLVLIALVMGIAQAACADPVTVVREYTYRAGDADSKLTCRTIALEQVKRLLLEELGSYLEAQTEIREATLTKDEIVTYTAGAVATVVIEERWNGEEYYMKAKITADAADVAKSVAALHEDREKAAELEQLRAQANESLKEIDRLRKDLAVAKATGGAEDPAKVASAQSDYNRAVARLSAKEYLEQGIRLRKSGSYREALTAFGKAIEVAPTWSRPYATRGATFVLVNDTGRALKDLDRAVELNPADMTVVAIHGVVLLKAGRKDEGLAELSQVADSAPNDVSLNTNVGGILIKNKMPGEAVSFLTRAIDLAPRDRGRACFLRAQAYSQLGKNNEAMNDLKRAARQGNRKARELLRTSRE